MNQYISNVDSASALCDRLITERIKQYFFMKDGFPEKSAQQDKIILQLKLKLSEAFTDVFEGRYDVLSENRTFNSDVGQLIDNLTIFDIEIGESDRARLKECISGKPDVFVMVLNELKLRVNNENRSKTKNAIDTLFLN